MFLDQIIAQDGGSSPARFRLVNSSGQTVKVEMEGEKFQDGSEILALLHLHEVSAGHDSQVSEKEDLESFLATAESMIESMVQGAFIVDVGAKIMMVNQALLDTLGFRRYNLVDMPVGALFARDKDGIEKATARFARIMKYGKSKDLDMELVSASGERVPVSFTGSVIRSKGNELLGVLSVVKDMREDRILKELERKNLELEKAYAELKGLDAMKDDLVSLVGHELRAPLSNILGYSEFLMEESLSRDETVEFSSIIYQESRRLSRLVNDILDLSRLERGKLVYNFIKGNLNELIRMSLKAVDSSLREKNISLELSLDSRIPVMEFDPDRIQQVVVNILDNAIKFSEPGKKIRITSAAGEGEALVSITDEGLGIPQEHSHKVFNKFEQIEDVRKHSKGSGLGMPIAKLIIEDGHKGRLWFESRGRNMGTTFHMVLPEIERE